VNTIFEQLKRLPYFADLPDPLLQRVCVASEELEAVPGETIIEEGSPSDGLYVVTDGELEVTKFSGGRSVPLARVGAGAVLGEISLLDDVPRIATVTAITDVVYIKVPSDTFAELLEDPKMVLRMLRTVTSRLRETEGLMRSEERMAGLGRMAAGLMHEINNPMAAVRHGTNSGHAIIEALGDTARRLSLNGVVLPDEKPSNPLPEEMSPLARADAEDSLGEWLSRQGVTEGWELAPALLDAGDDPVPVLGGDRGVLGQAAGVLYTDLRVLGASWRGDGPHGRRDRGGRVSRQKTKRQRQNDRRRGRSPE